MNKIIFSVAILLTINQFSIAQNVGIGTSTPLSLLHVSKGTVSFTVPDYLIGSPPKPPILGKGFRTFWYAEKTAFRTGQTKINWL